ncbi:unnamed protein product [Sphagnum jensenii]|uniref:Pentatricopeptide repeat-containing protein n=1 Tax=Sphagnum jensenii TaxID=128206 RepID=A0ABP0WSH6_9BRYO
MASLPSLQLLPSQARRTGWRGRPAAGILLLRDCAPSELQHQISQFQHSAAAGCAAAIAVPTAAQWVERKAARRDRKVGQKRIVEELWQKFFSDPSQWWDHRSEKVNAKYPDFKHKKTEEALWLCSNLCPKWVQAELVAAILPGTLESTPLFAWNTKLARYVKNGKSDDAMNLFQQMQQECVKPDSNVEMGERIAKRVLEVDPKDATCYALLSEIRAATEKL